MHISLFAMLVMHGPQGAHPPTPGTEAQDPPPQLSLAGGGVGVAIVGVPWVAELCSNQQAKS